MGELMVVNKFQDMHIFTLAVYQLDTIKIIDVVVGSDKQCSFKVRFTIDITIARIFMASGSLLLVDD